MYSPILLTTLLVVTALLQQRVCSALCPTGYTDVFEGCYIVGTGSKPHAQAITSCADLELNSKLIDLETKEEFDAVVAWTQTCK